MYLYTYLANLFYYFILYQYMCITLNVYIDSYSVQHHRISLYKYIYKLTLFWDVEVPPSQVGSQGELTTDCTFYPPTGILLIKKPSQHLWGVTLKAADRTEPREAGGRETGQTGFPWRWRWQPVGNSRKGREGNIVVYHTVAWSVTWSVTWSVAWSASFKVTHSSLISPVQSPTVKVNGIPAQRAEN